MRIYALAGERGSGDASAAALEIAGFRHGLMGTRYHQEVQSIAIEYPWAEVNPIDCPSSLPTRIILMTSRAHYDRSNMSWRSFAVYCSSRDTLIAPSALPTPRYRSAISLDRSSSLPFPDRVTRPFSMT